MSTTVKSSAKKRVSESEAAKPEKLKRDAIEDDFDAALSDDIKGIVSTLQLIREKAQKDGQKKNEETISRLIFNPKGLAWGIDSKNNSEPLCTAIGKGFGIQVCIRCSALFFQFCQKQERAILMSSYQETGDIMSGMIREKLLAVFKYLTEKNFQKARHEFECESGLFFDIKYFEELVVNGDWDEADRYLSCFTKWDDNRHSMKMFFEIKKQKYFEALDKCNFHEAADILTNELKVFSESDQELTKEMTDLLKNKREHRQLTGHANMEIQRKNLMGMLFNKLLINHPIISEKLQFPTLADSTLKHQFPKGSPNYSDASLASQSAHLVPVGQIEVGQVEPLQTIARPVPDPLSLPQNNIPTINQQGGSKPKSKPKKEKTEEERKFRRRAKYFLVTQLVAVLVFLSLLGGSDDAEVELDDDDSLNYND